MLEQTANKKQKIVDLIKDCAPSAPPEAPSAKPVCTHIQHGGTVFNIHPGATIGPITTIHFYAQPKTGAHGL